VLVISAYGPKKNLFVNKWEATKQITDWDIPRSCPTS
jgi:hypothetical protein